MCMRVCVIYEIEFFNFFFNFFRLNLFIELNWTRNSKKQI